MEVDFMSQNVRAHKTWHWDILEQIGKFWYGLEQILFKTVCDHRSTFSLEKHFPVIKSNIQIMKI